MKNTEEPKPGSSQAIELGCRCRRMDNHDGDGVEISGEILFWINGDCPIHGLKKYEQHS